MSNLNKVQPDKLVIDDPESLTMAITLGLDKLQSGKQPGDEETVEDQILEQHANPAARIERNVAETAQNEPKADPSLTTALPLSHSAIEQSEAIMNASKATVSDQNHTLLDPAS